MHIHFSPQTIDALVQVISGGNGQDRVGIYRSGTQLDSFMRGCNVSMRVGNGSRLPTLAEALERANRSEDQTILRTIAERAADPRDFLDEPERQQAVVDCATTVSSCRSSAARRDWYHRGSRLR
ncbi:hypothetical protein [Devosia salina]|uniref:Uncharacterized protein n=1 Tax=Devosia salina TaxID=2860336 RepID=A0ABX8WA53_9HYPH|nr:hypothetical protein [Devosia salina]QYO75597.1 hypothetical protein K1X15_13250 [Devosia salina]